MNEQEHWQAVIENDSHFDGQFVYGVRSTGIYCRPSCSSRRPRREQVQFFDDTQAAEAAGFRSCKRCRPTQPASANPQAELVHRACLYIETNLDGDLSLDLLGTALSSSPYHLQRTFKRLMGVTPRQYAQSRRLERLKGQLKQGEPITRALYEVGYNSGSRLYEQAPAQLGMTPAAYRKGGPGAEISYTITPISLGYLLVASTHKGLCAVTLGDTEAALETGLQAEYSVATLRRDTGSLKHNVSLILAQLEGQTARLDLPLDLQATVFQQRVWQELQNIPYGATRSYAQVAQAIGQPKAVRAVAHACATNRVALVIPCHRVIRENGSLGGYRWGLERKKQLLEQEHRYSAELSYQEVTP